MAILTGMQTKLRGSAGSITFRRNCGQTIVSEKITDMRVSRTEQQARQRTKWANIVAIYKGIRPLLNYGFESKPKGLSDYNMFMRLNMQKTPVYLTKQAVAGGACVAAPYVISFRVLAIPLRPTSISALSPSVQQPPLRSFHRLW